MPARLQAIIKQRLAVFCCVLLITSGAPLAAQDQQQPDATVEGQTPKIPNDQLDSLVAPIALYPDPLLAQILAASTYPLEIVQLQQWLGKHQDLKDEALADAVQKENWDPSIQAMAALPDVVKRLADDIQWTTNLGNAFLAQQSDVMDAVQRMRVKAKGTGNLKSNEQMKVETKVVENKSVVVIQQANPQVIYVPTYNPTVVYGPPVYPYPPIYYPPPGYYAAGMAISFGVGLAIGAAWGGGWGWGCGWGHRSVNINVNNTYISHYNRTNVSNRIGGGGNNWQHNPQHRGGTPYSNSATAKRYGGATRGESMATRQARARQTGGRQQAGARPSQGQMGGKQQPGVSNRAAGGAASARTGGAGGGGDRIGNRSVSRGASGGSSALGGGSGGFSGSSARASSSRGASSMGGSRGGGKRR